MLINQANLGAIFTGFQTVFNQGFTGAKTVWPQIAMKVASSTREETYGWLGQFPKMREWIGPRAVMNLSAHGFTVANKDFEQTIAVPRNDIMDDRIGVFTPMFQEMGRSAAEVPDELIFGLLAGGFTGICYDGQPFFDVDHPVGDGAIGPVTSVSNTQAGAGEPWFLLDCSRAIKPLVYQERMPFNKIVTKDRPEDDNVFMDKEFIYGVDGRANAGYGLWQLAFGSKATLDAANYAAARAAMKKFKGDAGRHLGIEPDTLVVGPDNESAALKLLNSEITTGGVSNEWKGTAKLIVTPWADAA